MNEMSITLHWLNKEFNDELYFITTTIPGVQSYTQF
jgi:hypothetical protein